MKRIETRPKQSRGGFGAGALLIASLTSSAAFAQNNMMGVDPNAWTPEYIRSIAGTETYDTAEHCSSIVPLDHTGRLTFWWIGPNQGNTRKDHEIDEEFWAAWAETYPNIEAEVQSVDYSTLIDRFRTTLLGNAAPMVVRLPILAGVEFSSKGYLSELSPEDIGFTDADFWPGAIKSNRWEGKSYGIPVSNETMALIWNADIFERAGLDPESPPETWADVVDYSRQIKEKLDIPGFGLVARQNAGNTPYRFMPMLWAFGGGALDESTDNPEYQDIFINNEGSKAALQAIHDMYVRDKSVPVSALTNTQNDNIAPYIVGRLGMMIAHPSEYAKMVDLAAVATEADKEVAETVVKNMRYGLMPKGPSGERAVVFGGNNMHIVADEFVDGGLDKEAALAFACFWNSPEWSIKRAWAASNPGNLLGFRTEWMAQRLAEIPFLDVTSSMLPYGVPFPVIPESTEIMNIVVPDMMQNVLTGMMSVEDAADTAAAEIRDIIGQ